MTPQCAVLSPHSFGVISQWLFVSLWCCIMSSHCFSIHYNYLLLHQYCVILSITMHYCFIKVHCLPSQDSTGISQCCIISTKCPNVLEQCSIMPSYSKTVLCQCPIVPSQHSFVPSHFSFLTSQCCTVT